jgi:DNA-binding beta-propeller fold protein YncE
MMSDRLYEIDAFTFEVSRSLAIHPHAEMMMAHHGVASPQDMMNHDGEASRQGGEKDSLKNDSEEMQQGEMEHEGGEHEAMMQPAKPTWAAPHPTRPFVYVANNGIDEIAEVQTESWTVTRRFPTEKAPYNIDVAPNGRQLVVTHKGAASIGVIDLDRGAYQDILPTSRNVTHGVVVSPDSRFAFVTSEGIGGESGVVDVFDLQALEHVATVEIGKQAGGIAFWKMEE